MSGIFGVLLNAAIALGKACGRKSKSHQQYGCKFQFHKLSIRFPRSQVSCQQRTLPRFYGNSVTLPPFLWSIRDWRDGSNSTKRHSVFQAGRCSPLKHAG